MNIYSILDLLSKSGRVEGPDSSGNYKCHCPAHSDKAASLSVKDGDRGILFKCHAGCDSDKICRSLGIDLKDLMHDDNPPAKKDGGKPWERIEKQYAYTDENGKVLYYNVRLHSPKDFRQTMPDPAHPGRMIWKLDRNLRKVLYRLPEIRKAIDFHQTIYIVEGEKDADNLFALGYAATTNAAGGNQKWDDAYSRQLSGAKRIVILGDNDKTGYQHQIDVSDAIDAMRQVDDMLPKPEMVLLTKVWPDMPRKADISDLLKAFGDEEGEQMLRRAVEMGASYGEVRAAYEATMRADQGDKAPKAEPAADTQSVSQLIGDKTEQGDAYRDVNGYAVVNGCLCGMNADGGIKQLTTFSAIPRRMVIRDDGENVSTVYEVEGWNRDGRALGTATVKASEFGGMGWVAEHWGFEANILPGNTIKDRVRYAMIEAGRKTASKETVYTHTGWRTLGGKLVYLHGSGAVGADNISVSLEGKLDAYSMSAEPDMSVQDACMGSMMLFSAMSTHVAYPVMAMAYLAPLVSFMDKKGCAPRFGLWLLGSTQSGKTTAALLCLSHFGNFNSQDKIPASFTDTANSVQRSAFLLKDMPILVDDYFPVSNAQERRKMEAMAQSLSRSVGNGASRGRLNADMQQRTGYKPRGVTLFTGEDVPDIKESGLARFFLVNVKRGDVYMGEGLTELQEMAAQGMLVKAMRGYVEWLAKQADTLPDRLYAMFKEYRSLCREGMGAAGARACEALACMMTATSMMLDYFFDAGAIDARQKEDMLAEAIRVNCDTARAQAREIREQKPTTQFLEILRELLASGANKCLDVGEISSSINVIGWQDQTYYYFMPELTYKAVSKFCADQGTAFPITLTMLRKSLVEEHIISEDYTNRVKKVRGRTARYIWLPREIIDGREELTKQQKMTEQADSDMPF